MLRVSDWGTRAMVVVAVLALVFTMVNVQVFAAAGHPVSSFEWWIAWLLDPMASITLGTAIVFEGLLAGYGRREGWLAATKWYAGGCTWLMNIWSSVAAGSPAGMLLHSVAPGLVLFLAESAPRVRRHLAEIVTNLARQAEKLEAELVARQVAEAQRQAKEAADARARQDAERQLTPGIRQVTTPGEQPKPTDRTGVVVTPEPATSVPPAIPRQFSPAGAPDLTRPPVRQAPAKSPATSSPARQVSPAGDASLADLVNRVRPLVAQGLGRAAIAKQLGITEHQARQAMAAVKTEQQRPALHAVAAGKR